MHSSSAIQWLLAQKPFIVPAPGTSKVKHLEEKVEATSRANPRLSCTLLPVVFPPARSARYRFHRFIHGGEIAAVKLCSGRNQGRIHRFASA